jgi:molybdenum cofactor cytidylyltransferase
MQLSTSLRVEPGQALAFVGAGGKTTAIARLVTELSSSIPLLVTTTTHLGHDQERITSKHVLETDLDWRVALREYLQLGQSVLLTGAADSEGKWTSPANTALTAAHEIAVESGGVTLIEADGARGRSLKAPAGHEPAIPGFVRQVILLAGMNALGEPLSDERVHRPELAGPIMGLGGGETIGVEHMARLLSHSSGGLKDIPPRVQVRCLLNCDSSQQKCDAGEQVAGELMKVARFTSVIVSDLVSPDPVQLVLGRVGCVVLAAGGSKRFGRQKLLEPWRGEAIIRHGLRAILQAGLEPVVVVTGAESDRLRGALSDLPLEYVHNPDWEQGQSGSLRLGLESVADRAEAVLFALGDMPLIKPDLINALLDEHRRTLAPVIAPSYDGRPANPVLFDRVTYDALETIRGDQGGRAVYDRFPPRLIKWGESAAIDIDNLEDLRRLESGASGEAGSLPH